MRPYENIAENVAEDGGYVKIPLRLHLGLQREVESLGFQTIPKYATEGLIWFAPFLNEKWEDKNSGEILLNILRNTENEQEIMGMSPHFLVVSRK